MKSPVRILIVEDEIITAMSLKMVLDQAGFSVQNIVTTGEDAISNSTNEFPDIIIMDINLAGRIDGIEAAKRIKNQKDIPIIFMTGYADKTFKERASVVNPIHYFIKPIDNLDLIRTINSAFA